MAINKPNSYEETPASTGFTPVELGGHKLVIKQVSETKSRSGRDMIAVLFDFADTDKQPGYFAEQFKNDIRPDKKWPNQAIQYILTDDNEGKCNRAFKTFITCVEHSNPGFTVQWGDKFCECFENKLAGGVFGIIEEEYNGKRRKKREMRWFCSVDKVTDAPIPEEKLLTAGSGQSYNDGFMNIPDGINEELPFN